MAATPLSSVLITGGTGFVGLNLAEVLLARGDRVVIAGLEALPAAAGRRFGSLPGLLETEILDVRDEAALGRMMRRHGVTRLFPFAAVTAGPAREAASPEAMIEVNLLGMVAQLRAARDAGVQRVVLPSSMAVYGETAFVQPVLDETAPCVPSTLYGVSKYAVERAGLRLAVLWGLDAVAARIGSLFGPWERDTGVRDLLTPFHRAVRLAAAGSEAVLPVSLPISTFIYARDAASALTALMDMPHPAHRVFNVAGGIHLRTALPTFCRALTGLRTRVAADGEGATLAPAEMRDRGQLDGARLAAAGWQPAYDEAAACADYASWLRMTAWGSS